MNLVIAGQASPVSALTLIEATINTQVKSAERNADGRLVRETLPDKWTVSCEWEFSNPEQAYPWFNHLASLTREDFSITFPAPTGQNESRTFYISPISAKMLNFSRGNSGWWKSIKCNFVEV